jgi:hypothetical protein
MKKKLMFILAGAVVAAALVFAVPAVFAQQANPPATPNTPPPPTIPHERHPAIRRAIFALKAAKADLEHADHDFGGHRAAALDECDKAIAQLQAALQYDQQ